MKTPLLVTFCVVGLSSCATVESYVEQVLEAPTGGETVQQIYVEGQAQAQETYIEEPYVEERTEQRRTSQKNVRVYEDQTFGIERYDEYALDDYVDGIKGAVQFLTAMQTPDSPAIMQGTMLLGIVQGKIRTAKIEIEEWPLAAKEKAWEIQGSRITKYNELVTFEKERILSNEAFDINFRKRVESINLLTKDSLFNQ